MLTRQLPFFLVLKGVLVRRVEPTSAANNVLKEVCLHMLNESYFSFILQHLFLFFSCFLNIIFN